MIWNAFYVLLFTVSWPIKTSYSINLIFLEPSTFHRQHIWIVFDDRTLSSSIFFCLIISHKNNILILTDMRREWLLFYFFCTNIWFNIFLNQIIPFSHSIFIYFLILDFLYRFQIWFIFKLLNVIKYQAYIGSNFEQLKTSRNCPRLYPVETISINTKMFRRK